MSRSSSRERILQAAQALIERRGGADVSMAEIADAAGVSRQALYLHFADRAALLAELVQQLEDSVQLQKGITAIRQASDGITAIRNLVHLQAVTNPSLWALARAFDAVRRRDPESEAIWQFHLQNRRQGCQGVIALLQQQGRLRTGLPSNVAADLLWTMTSLRCWEDLVLQAGWSARRYEEWVADFLLQALTGEGTARAPRKRKRKTAG